MGAKNLAAVADALDLSTSALANRKKAGSLPYDKIVQVAIRKNVNLRWLFTGEIAKPEIDVQLVGEIVEALYRIFGNLGVNLGHRTAAEIAVSVYRDVVPRSEERAARLREAEADLERIGVMFRDHRDKVKNGTPEQP